MIFLRTIRVNQYHVVPIWNIEKGPWIKQLFLKNTFNPGSHLPGKLPGNLANSRRRVGGKNLSLAFSKSPMYLGSGGFSVGFKLVVSGLLGIPRSPLAYQSSSVYRQAPRQLPRGLIPRSRLFCSSLPLSPFSPKETPSPSSWAGPHQRNSLSTLSSLFLPSLVAATSNSVSCDRSLHFPEIAVSQK